MKTIKILLALTVLFIAIPLNSSASDFIIRYDYIKGTTEYYKITKKGDTVRVRNPLVRQNQNITVEVINYNENAMIAHTVVTTESVVESSNPFQFFSMLSPVFSTVSKGVLNNMFEGSGIDMSDVDYSMGFSSGTVDEDDPLLKQATITYNNFNDQITDLVLLEKDIRNIERNLNELYRISVNKTLPPEEIKEKAREVVSSALKNGDDPKYANFQRKRAELTEAIDGTLQIAKRSGKNYLKIAKEGQPTLGFSSEANEDVYLTLAEETEEYLSALDKFENQHSIESIEQDLDAMMMIYENLQTSDFTYSTSTSAEGDRTNINIKFYDKPIAVSGGMQGARMGEGLDDDPDMLEEKTFKVNVRGGIKIEPSVGISFTTFGDHSKDFYALGDSVIASEDGQNFAPNISGFINFYPYTGRSISFGGTFGIGVPVSGGKFKPNFLLGGALVLGNKYRIMLNGGMSIGPVDKLAEGQQLGQELMPFQEIKTKSTYKVGAFAGISFTLGIGN